MDRILSFCRQRVVLITVAAALVLLGAALNPGLAATGGGLLVFGLINVNDDLIRVLIKQGLLDSAGGLKRNIVTKTADTTIATGTHASGTIFTNRGAVATVIFTLPAPVAALAGVFYEFLGIADYTITVKTATADTLIVVNDLTADSLSMQTSAHLIGAHMRAVCDGTSWIAYGDSVGDTFTAAT